MILSGIDLSGTLRLTQPNDALDIELALFKTGQVKIEPDFYALVFFRLITGEISGQDGGGVVTGIKFKLFDDSDNVIAETPTGKLDWYEGTGEYYIEAPVETDVTLANDVYIAKVNGYFIGNKEGTAEEIPIFESTTPAGSKFSSGQGIKVNAASGVLHLTAKYLLQISK